MDSLVYKQIWSVALLPPKLPMSGEQPVSHEIEEIM